MALYKLNQVYPVACIAETLQPSLLAVLNCHPQSKVGMPWRFGNTSGPGAYRIEHLASAKDGTHVNDTRNPFRDPSEYDSLPRLNVGVVEFATR